MWTCVCTCVCWLGGGVWVSFHLICLYCTYSTYIQLHAGLHEKKGKKRRKKGETKGKKKSTHIHTHTTQTPFPFPCPRSPTCQKICRFSSLLLFFFFQRLNFVRRLHSLDNSIRTYIYSRFLKAEKKNEPKRKEK